MGIPPEKQEQIFESFHQIHEGVLRRVQEGTGLGLTVARHLAILMGGTITLDSRPGHGSRFTVTLPLADEKPKS
jgi:two-component system sensor histidine kinase SenX3